MPKQGNNIVIAGFILLLALFGCKAKQQVSEPEYVLNEEAIPAIVQTLTADLPVPELSNEKKLKTTIEYYETAFTELKAMLEDEYPLNFKRAVFVTENAYFKELLSYDKFNTAIQSRADICRDWMKGNPVKGYAYPDSLNFLKNAAIYTLMKDTIELIENFLVLKPFEYDFKDFLGEEAWSNQFVLKLLTLGSGNCHSLPYLYKILADELKADVWLSLAPNHIYLKHYSDKWRWYNTELTSGDFPTDGWIKASGYITVDAIRNGMYMDTLSDKQSIALCVYDLAKGYIAQTNKQTSDFIIRCCNFALAYHSQNINALILKAETLRHQYDYLLANNKQEKAARKYAAMQNLYKKGIQAGYREMPKAMYVAWMASIKTQADKYTHNELTNTFNTVKP